MNIEIRVKSTRSNKREKLSEEIMEEIVRLYESGVSSKEIASTFNLNDTTVPKVYKRIKGITSLLPNKGNERYFQYLDTHTKAYLLGFITADGCIVDNSNTSGSDTFAINIHEKDRYVLDTLKNEIGNEHPIYRIPSKNQVAVRLKSQILCDDLKQYGLSYRKSLTMTDILPNIPEQFRNSFILGYLDGDGWVHPNNSKGYKGKVYHFVTIGFCGTEAFLSGLARELRLTSTNIRHTAGRLPHHHGIYTLTFSSKLDIQNSFNYLYKDCPFFLQRKFSRWLPYVNIETILKSNPSILTLNQDQTISST